MRISDWSSDVCSSDLGGGRGDRRLLRAGRLAIQGAHARTRRRAASPGPAGVRLLSRDRLFAAARGGFEQALFKALHARRAVDLVVDLVGDVKGEIGRAHG